MNGEPKSRTPLLVVLALLALAGGGAAILLAGGEDDGDEAAQVDTDISTSAPAETTARTDTATTPETTATTADAEQQVEAVVDEYVESAAQQETVDCDLVVDDVCVQNESEIDLSAVQSQLDQLEVEDVQVTGDQATAQLNRGGSFKLRQQDGEWKISGFEPPTRDGRDDRGGGVEAPERAKPEPPERGGGVEAPSY